MAFLTENEYRKLEVTLSATEITTEQVNDFLQTAIDILESSCGSAAVAAVAAATDTSLLKTRQFRKAQQKLAAREMLLFIASRYRSGGIQVKETTDGESVNEYEKFSETEQRRKALWDEAMLQVGSYILTENVNEPVFAEGEKLIDCCNAGFLY